MHGQLRIDGVGQREVDLVGAEHGAEVVRRLRPPRPADAERHATVLNVAAEVRPEAAGECGLKGETVRIRLDGRELGGIDALGRVAAGDRRAVHAVQRCVVQHQKRLGVPPVRPAVREHARAVERVTPVVASGDRALRLPAERIHLVRVADLDAGVREDLVAVADLGRSPDLGGIRDVGVAGLDLGPRMVDLDAAAGRIRLVVLRAQVQEAAVREGQADVGRHGGGVAVALVILAEAGFHAAPLTCVAKDEVDDSRHGVGAVLRGRAVAQDLHAIERDRRYRGHVDAVRARGPPDRKPRDHRRAVAPLAVEQHEGGIRRQPPQGDRPHEGCVVTDRFLAHVQRRDDPRQHGVHPGSPLAQQLPGVQHVDRNRQVAGGALPATRPDDRDLFDGVVVRGRRVLRER